MQAPAGLGRRTAALIYDAFLVLALWVISTLLGVIFISGGEALAGPAFTAFLYFEVAAFYIYFWCVKGQTLGMQVWKIRAVNEAGELMTLEEGSVRFLFATLSFLFMGLGFLWILFDRDRLAWHDRASGTCVIYLGKEAYSNQGR